MSQLPRGTKLPACGFLVIPNPTNDHLKLKVKKVSKGKKISILTGIIGSRDKAISTLRQLLGVGGDISHEVADGIEIQGDQTGRLFEVLKSINAVLLTSPPPKITVVQRANYGYDKFMKKQTGVDAQVLQGVTGPMSDACKIVHGNYWPYCNGNCQLCPPLTDVFEGLDIFCSWYQEEKIPVVSHFTPDMSTSELVHALSQLGMRAEAGEAVREYESDKQKWRDRQVRPLKKISDIIRSSDPVHVPRVVRPIHHPDRPVRVILNTRYDDDEIWYILRVSMKERGVWISDYFEFINSLASAIDGADPPVNSDLVDSREMCLKFTTRHDRDACKQTLHACMENMLEISESDPTDPPETLAESLAEEEWEDYSHLMDPMLEETPLENHSEEEPIDIGISGGGPLEFQEIANSLGIDQDEIFWDIFTNYIDVSDGTVSGIQWAFEEAVAVFMDSRRD